MISKFKTAPERTAALLLAALWMVCVYRAVTQSIVHDEALTYQIYLAGDPGLIFNHFDANHHFLNTLLMKLSTSFFGFSALAMRLPALLGAALFFTALYRFSRWAFAWPWMLPILVAAVVLNPMVLDFMAAARGYGLALGLWMWALALIAPELERAVESGSHDRNAVTMAGACAALSVTANLVFAPPVLLLASIVVWFSFLERRAIRVTMDSPARIAPKLAKKRAKTASKPRPIWILFFAPAVAIAIVFGLLAPLEHMGGGDFYVGAASIAESMRSLGAMSLAHSGPAGYLSFAASHDRVWAGAVLAVLCLAWAAIEGLHSRNLALILTAVPAAGSALAILALHMTLAMPYPINRTGIYFIPAATLATMALSITRPVVLSAVVGVATLLIASYVIQFEPRSFGVWAYDADSSAVAQKLAEMAQTKENLSIGNSWQLEPALNFYRETRHLRLRRFRRDPIGPGFDVYVLEPNDRGRVRELGLNIVYRGPVSGTVIAVPR